MGVADAPSEAAAIQFHSDRRARTYGAVDVRPVAPAALATLERMEPQPEQWQRVFAVYTGDTTGLPMLGDYAVLHDTLRFTPRFPPVPGNSYVARFDAGALNELVGRRVAAHARAFATLHLTADTTPGSTVVTAAYPSADVLPQNLLRIYLQFSAPVSRGESFARVRLYNDADSLVENAFFTAGDAVELWDADHTRLTLLFDPGRIKRDLRPNEEAGLPLQRGRTYRLVVDSAWRDGEGRPLARGFEKRFRVGALDRSLPRTGTWSITAPRAGTREPLVLSFPEPLDHALLQRMVTVRRGDANVRGAIDITDGEKRWSFVPDAAWAADSHAVVVDADLEDVAGNSLRKLFDVAPGDTGAIGIATESVRIPFVPRSR